MCEGIEQAVEVFYYVCSFSLLIVSISLVWGK